MGFALLRGVRDKDLKKTMFKACIFPKNTRVHPLYSQYVGWSFVSTFCISAETVLSTHSMLAAVGAASSELAVSINYIGKDLIGQIGGVFYINRMGNMADKNPSRFIKHSMVLQQIATIAECATPLLPTVAFLPIASIANIGKNTSFMGFGAINATVIRKLAVDENTGEVYAKICAINTLASTLGMGVGLCIAAAIPDHTTRLAIVPLFGLARYVAYKKSISGLLEGDQAK